MPSAVPFALLNCTYASSISTKTSLGTASKTFLASSSESCADVGLFGLFKITRRVCSLIASIIASTSCDPSARLGILTLVAPAPVTIIGYASKLLQGYITSSPGPATKSTSCVITSVEPQPSTTSSGVTLNFLANSSTTSVPRIFG
ncbi:Uncharacterised protein [Chlamydia trachomatis]|nr:Uncharacterised protein [Chlamydia trachomatis]